MTAAPDTPANNQVSQGRFPATPPPTHKLETWGNFVCRYSTGNDGYERGVYIERGRGRTWARIGPLPHVLEVIEHLDGTGKHIRPSYRLAATPLAADPQRVTLVHDDDLGRGQWGGALGLVLSCDPKITQTIGTAIRAYCRDNPVPRSHSVPTWTDEGTLSLPSADVGPAGYGDTAPLPENQAREKWGEILGLCQRAPQVGLVAGIALGGLFIRPLRRESFTTLLAGAAGKGKTTALMVAGAVLGQPDSARDGSLVKPWSTTPIAMVQEAGQHGCLPMLRDEYGAAGLSPEKLESMILGLMNSAQRTVGGKDGTPRVSRAWYGVLIATSNDSISCQVANEGVTRRVIELDAPVTPDHETSDQLKDLARDCHGWPLRWLRTSGTTPEAVAELIAEAENALGLHQIRDSVPRSLGKHLALGVAGAQLLDQLVDPDRTGPHAGKLRAAALDTARAVLDELTMEARERGITPGARVLSAITHAAVARPASFPTREHYRAALTGEGLHTGLTAREIEGWDLSSDLSVDGDLAVLSGRLDAICADAGITNPGVGLRELDLAGATGQPGLLRSNDPEGRRVQRIYVGATQRRPSVYIFRLGEPPTATDTPKTGNKPSTAERTAPTSTNNLIDPAGAGSTVPGSFPVRSQSPPATGNGSDSAMTTGNEASKGGLVPGVPGFPSMSPIGNAVDLVSSAACAVCADGSQMWCGFGEIAEISAPCQVCGKPTPTRAACGAVRHGGCQVPPEAIAAGSATSSAPARPASSRRLRPVSSDAAGARPEHSADPAEELARFSRVVRTRHPDAGGENLTAALGLFTEITGGLRFVSFAGEVGVAHYARLIARHAAMPVPEPLGEDVVPAKIRLSVDFLDRKLPMPADAMVVGCDVNAQFLAAAHSCPLGDGNPIVGSPNPLGVIASETPGYVQMARAVNTGRLGLGKDGLGKLAKGDWIAVPVAKYLISGRDVELPVGEIVWWPKSGRRLSAWTKPLAHAYRTLKTRPCEDLAAAYALVAVKSVYTTFLGGMLRSARFTKSGLRRPDWADQLRSLAWANMWRALDKSEAAGAQVLGVYRDAAWFVTESSAPGAELYVPPGLSMTTAPGKWKVDRRAPLDEDMTAALRSGSVPRFAEALAAASGRPQEPVLFDQLHAAGLTGEEDQA